jgi:hypothetical protein
MISHGGLDEKLAHPALVFQFRNPLILVMMPA